ncbi:MAG: ion transporter [Bacteroidota bacterium]
MLKAFFESERNMIIAILLNAIIIFLLYFPQIQTNHPQLFWWLEYIDLLFVLFFLIEAVVKLYYQKPSKYFKSGWNQLDFWVVVFSLPSLLHLIPGFGIVHTSLFKLLRLVRLFRLIQFLYIIPNMEMIMKGLFRALRASIFVLLVLVFFNFMLAIFTCHFYGELVPEYFGDPLIASYYIFQMFTIEGWNEIPKVVAEAAEAANMPYGHLIIGVSRFYFILVVLLGGIFGMSLANAIFVDEMTLDNNQELEKEIGKLQNQIAEIKELLLKEKS